MLKTVIARDRSHNRKTSAAAAVSMNGNPGGHDGYFRS